MTFCSSCGKAEQEKAGTTAIDTIPMLITQVQKCSRLYTSEFQIHKIVTYDDVVRLKGNLFSQAYDIRLPLGDRKVAIPMDATLKAYIDFSNFSEQNVSRMGDRLTVTLPDPKVVLTDTKIDQDGVREFVGLTRSHFSDRELTLFEQQGRESIIQSIPQMDIIERARASAARQLVPIFTQMGFREENVTIVFRKDLNVNDLRRLLEN
jgi:hypothetical protein